MTDASKNGLWDWEGRIGRLQYFWVLLVTVVIAVPASIYLRLELERPNGPGGLFWLVLIAVVPLSYASLVAAIKRFHDIGKSGNYVLLTFIPLVNLAVGIYLSAPIEY
jgi:uncharacterized membrane protein YhaH (DUF805 family)